MTINRVGRAAGIAALALLGTCPAEADLYLYGLNAAGKTAINGNTVETLPGEFDPSQPAEDPEDSWVDLQVEGADRYALRRDGLVAMNGAKLATRLPSDDDDYWVSMAVDGGTRYAIRRDGKLAANEVTIASLPNDDDLFTRLLRHGGSTYSLRSDGNVYRDTNTEPLFRFREGDDGDDYDSIWVALKVHPTNGYLYALRTDGSLFRGLLTAAPGGGGEQVTHLPSDDNPELGDLYADLDMDSLGRWVALRRDGRVYRDPDPANAWFDFPGSASDEDTIYMDLAMWGDSFFALRSDGRIYSDLMGADAEVLVMSGSWYWKLAVGAEYPVMAATSNTAPYVTGITATVVVGTPVHLPIVITDAESPAAGLTVAPVLPLPTGAVYDDATRTLHWDAPTVKGS
ncbi:MAG: hypothetical protein JXR77_07320, partial [Lentisphaeria bacterium]|nr:hypothetical protein [Lentisphaeria bacterium]